ncbi:MAG: hypothetical protein MJ159_02030 [Treponemataceae bacterium]|nr:hypothetical protein [Treponemataceae bacterium]
MKTKNFFCRIVLSLIVSGFMFADTGILSIPDSSSIREQSMEAWLTAPISAVIDRECENLQTDFGQVFQIRAERQGSELAIIYAPRENNYDFPAKAPGSWVVYRDCSSGKILRINVYFQFDSRVYVCLRPDSQPKKPKSEVDLIIHGAYACRGVPLGIPFSDVMKLSFSELFNLTKETVPWAYVKADSRNYVNNRYMIEKINRKLPQFEYIEDAAYDEFENPVFISTGEARSGTPGKIGVNCSGFTKWVIDGITIALSGSATKLDAIKAPTIDLSETLYMSKAEEEEMFRSYDWIRNLATAAVCAERDKEFPAGTLGVDVQVNPFAGLKSADGTVRNVGFVPKAGYEINMIKPLLYVLAATEPDMLYLGAVKTCEWNTDNEPETWTFHHDLVFFPYFDQAGVCHIEVYESGVATSFDDFVAANQGTYVYLCRVKSSNCFQPL